VIEKQKDLFDVNLIHVESMNKKSKGTFYTIDSAKLTCSCPAFAMGMTRPCKHMKAVLSTALLDKCSSNSQTYKLARAKIKEGNGVSGLYTVGHSNYPVEHLIEQLLKPNEITTVIDVRAKPYSRYNPQYNRPDIAASLYKAGIRYLWGGYALGGMGKCCPDVETPKFQEAMNKVIEFANIESVALMCSERNPKECHRAMKLTAYCNQLQPDLHPQHIVSEGLIDSATMEQDMPVAWFWHEFGGEYTASS